MGKDKRPFCCHQNSKVVVCPCPVAINMFKSIKLFTRTKCQESVYKTTGPLVWVSRWCSVVLILISHLVSPAYCMLNCVHVIKWAASSEFGTYRLCEQGRFRWACASAQSHQNLRCSLIQAVSQEEPSDRKPDPWPLWVAGHAQLKFAVTECSKTQIRLTRLT